MNQLRLGRFSLLFAAVALTAIAATFFVPTLFVLSGIFAAATLFLGILGVRTRAGRIGLLVALFALPCATLLAYYYGIEGQARRKQPAHSVSVYFSPNGGCTDAIISQIAGAKKTVLVQAYWFTSPPIAQALVEAHKRGVTVQVVLDKSQETAKYSGATYLANNGIPPLIDHMHAIAHNKVMIIDSAVVITGSMNFTISGEKSNAENVLVIHDVSIAATYTDNWTNHAAHSKPYQRR